MVSNPALRFVAGQTNTGIFIVLIQVSRKFQQLQGERKAFGVLVPRDIFLHLDHVYSPSECHFSPQTGVILVGSTLHITVLSADSCSDAAKTKRSSEQSWPYCSVSSSCEGEQHETLMFFQSPLGKRGRYGNTITKWPQWTTTSGRLSGEIWQIPCSFLYVRILTTIYDCLYSSRMVFSLPSFPPSLFT